jgi:serine hydrolase
VKRQALFIHAAGDKRSPDGSGGLIAYLEDHLAGAYEVLSPDMPDPDQPRYRAWTGQIAGELAALNNDPILIGHSLGASVLLKYLSEGAYQGPVAGLFLIATPYWGDQDWEIEWALPEDFPSRIPPTLRIFLYHSRSDPEVPFAHLGLYQDKLPQATARGLEGDEHSFITGLPELVDDIKSL